MSYSHRRNLFRLILSFRVLLLFLFLWPNCERVEDSALQLCCIKPALDLASLHKRNQPRLFRHHDRHRISIFSDANRGAMACAEISRESWIQCQRKKAGSGGDTMSTNDDRSIVQRARRVEDTNQQVVTELRIELHTTVSNVLQTDVSFDHDQRAGLR